MPMKDRTQVAVFVPAAEAEAFSFAADADGRSVSSWMRRAAMEKLERDGFAQQQQAQQNQARALYDEIGPELDAERLDLLDAEQPELGGFLLDEPPTTSTILCADCGYDQPADGSITAWNHNTIPPLEFSVCASCARQPKWGSHGELAQARAPIGAANFAARRRFAPRRW